MSRRQVAVQASTLTVPSTVNSRAFDTNGMNTAVVFVDATIVVATGTLDVTIEDSPDGTRWFTHTAFTQITAAGKAVKRITNLGRYVRIVSIVGTANVTFQIDMELDQAS